ncbi:MAG: CoA transferase [Chloroflexi bacterium]|nr:CoA transferase [Chloroflexota bacterium]MDA1003831.1 CoA transferase [Chloroflexota bacterium]
MVDELAGVRVVDLSDDVAGAYAAKLLAGVGADVIKVEPPAGDPTRQIGPRVGDTLDGSILFAYLNTGKRGVVLDPADGAQLAQLRALIAGADLVIESGAPGAWRERGIDFDAMIEAHPALVVCSITPFGQDGSRAHWRATALTAFAAGGQMALCGEPDQPPLKTAGHQAHYQTGLHGFSASVTALLAARRSGRGDRIDISIQEAQASALEGAGPNALTREVDSERTGNSMRAIWGIYPCADGFVGVASMARQSASVFRLIGHPELMEQGASNLLADPTMNDVVKALITEWTAARTSREIFDESQRHRAPFSLIPTPRDLIEWEPLRLAGFWSEVEHPVLGRHILPSLPFVFDGDRPEQRRAPLFGEHTAEVLAEIVGPRTLVLAAGAQGDSPPPLPLEGIRVLDATQIWAGPFATRFLGDMGADVIHIEGPTFPDGVRGIGRGDDPRVFNKSAYFNEYNRNKRGLGLDLHSEEGREAFRRLVPHADVVIENWSVGVAERLGLSYDELRALKPDIVFVQMPGFSQVPPESERVGFGPTIEQMGGLVALQGYEGGEPHKSGISYGDPTAGIVAAGATALALLHRERTGEGSHVVVAQRDNIIGLIGEYIVAESLGVDVPTRIGSHDPDYAPHNVYRARDDSGRIQSDLLGNPLREFNETFLSIATDGDDAWQALRTVVGDARLDAPAFATATGRRAGEALIDEVLAEWVRQREASVAAAELQAAGVSAMPVLTPLMIFRDAHLRSRDYFPLVAHPEAGTLPTTRPVWRMQRRPLPPIRPAPCFGEHNEAILRELAGFDAAAIAAMRERNVITDAPLNA